MKDWKVKHVLSRDGYQWQEEGYKKRVKEGEYGRCILYYNSKTCGNSSKKVRGVRENDGGDESN
jgi:hypothetical protein